MNYVQTLPPSFPHPCPANLEVHVNDLLFVQKHHPFQDLMDHSSSVIFRERIFSNSSKEFTSSSSIEQGGEGEERGGERGEEGREGSMGCHITNQRGKH